MANKDELFVKILKSTDNTYQSLGDILGMSKQAVFETSRNESTTYILAKSQLCNIMIDKKIKELSSEIENLEQYKIQMALKCIQKEV